MYFSFEIEKVGAIKCAIEMKRSNKELHKVSESIFKFIMKYFSLTLSREGKGIKHRRRKICTNCRISVSFALLLFTSIEIAQQL
jgi:hypothetical protein